MAKVITFVHTKGEFIGKTATCIPAAQADVAGFYPEIEKMTEAEYLNWIIARDITPLAASNVTIKDSTLL